MKKNNLRTIRLHKGVGLERLSTISGVPVTTLHRIENGQPIDKYLPRISAALNCNPKELIEPEFDIPTVPIVGVVKFKSYIKMLPEKEWDPTEHIEGLSEKARAIRIGGSHLKPHFHIDTVLYYNGAKAASEKIFLERQCLVEIPTRNRRAPSHLLCWVSKGTKPGLYVLIPYGGDMLFDQPILKAYPILYIRQG